MGAEREHYCWKKVRHRKAADMPGQVSAPMSLVLSSTKEDTSFGAAENAIMLMDTTKLLLKKVLGPIVPKIMVVPLLG